MPNDKRFYLNELKGEQCWCEKPKKKWYSFCYSCFKKLPRDLQQKLYRKIGDGYEKAYDQAVQFLSEDT